MSVLFSRARSQQIYHSYSRFIDRILKGSKPADLHQMLLLGYATNQATAKADVHHEAGRWRRSIWRMQAYCGAWQLSSS
jgi:hypothetical protein